MMVTRRLCVLFMTLVSASCVSSRSLVTDLNQQSNGFRQNVGGEQQASDDLSVETNRLKSRLASLQNREKQIAAQEESPAEEAEKKKIRQEILSLLKLIKIRYGTN